MAVTPQNLLVTIRELARGCMTLDDAMVIAEHAKTEAEIIASREFSQSIEKDPRFTTVSPTWTLAAFLWRLCGSTACLKGPFLGHDDALNGFLGDKLHKTPDDFSDDDLDYLLARGLQSAELVRIVQRNRVLAKVKVYRSQQAELTADVAKVKNRVATYGFNADLNSLLEKVEDGLVGKGDKFDQAALLKHLRTFFEKLHQQVGETLRNRLPQTVDGTDLTKCGQAIDFLQRKGVLTEKMRDLARALYSVLSNEGVHAIKSEREYIRLCRNMVAEYALVLFFELDRVLSP